MKRLILLPILLLLNACASSGNGPAVETITHKHLVVDRTTVERGRPGAQPGHPLPGIPPSPQAGSVPVSGKWVKFRTKFLFQYNWPLNVFIGPAIHPISDGGPQAPGGPDAQAVGPALGAKPGVPIDLYFFAFKVGPHNAAFNLCLLPVPDKNGFSFDGTMPWVIQKQECQVTPVEIDPTRLAHGLTLVVRQNMGYGPKLVAVRETTSGDRHPVIATEPQSKPMPEIPGIWHFLTPMKVNPGDGSVRSGTGSFIP